MKRLEAITLRDVLPSRDDAEIRLNMQSADVFAPQRDFVIDMQPLAVGVSRGALSVDRANGRCARPCRGSLDLGSSALSAPRQNLRVMASAKRRCFGVKTFRRIRNVAEGHTSPANRPTMVFFAETTSLQVPTSRGDDRASTLLSAVQEDVWRDDERILIAMMCRKTGPIQNTQESGGGVARALRIEPNTRAVLAESPSAMKD